MKPKKKGILIYIIYVLFLGAVVFLALHGAVVHQTVIDKIETGEIEEYELVLEFLDLFPLGVSAAPFSFTFNSLTRPWLIYSIFGWLLVVLSIELNKKKFIQGKEYGTAEWGKKADIEDLFASSIEADEIKTAKRMRTPLGRWRVRRKLFKKCEKDGESLLRAKMKRLEETQRERKLNGTASRRQYNAEKKAIECEVRESVETAKQFAWLPRKAKVEYKARLQEIKYSHTYTNSEKKRENKRAKKEYNQKLKEFFNYGKRVTKIKKKYEDADMIFTQTERISFFNWVLNMNTLVLGGSGSGKTRGFVMPNILQGHSSYIVTDPKGEILEKAGYFLSEIAGYKIRVLNLDEMTQSDCYNPFVYIHPNRDGYEERVLTLIETIIINTEDGEKKSSPDPFWPMAERLFLQSIFFFTADGFVPEAQNMDTVLQLIGMLEIGEEEDKKQSDLDIFVQQFADKFGEKHIGVQQFREFRSKASGKTAKSIVISAVARLAPFRASEVNRIFTRDDMQLDMVGEEKTALFVVVPPTTKTFNFIAGMLFTQLFQELQYCAAQKHKHEGQRLPVPCRFILDEFANTCTIPNFVQILAYARSFGIGITPILQSLEQIKKMYKDEWGVIVDNCNTLLYLGSITHGDTLEYMSKLLGKGTFDKRTSGRTRGRSGSSSQNFDVIGRELLDSAEIRKLPKPNCLLVVGGRNPFYSEKYDYTSHPNYRFTSDANKKYSYHYIPLQKRESSNESAHGEDKKAVKPSEKAKVEIAPVTIETSPEKTVDYVMKHVESVGVIPDEELKVEDGEDTKKEIASKTVAELLAEEKAAKTEAMETAQTVSRETTEYLDNLRNDRIRIEENLIKQGKRLGRVFRNCEIISDEELRVEDGEDYSDADEKTVEIIFDDDINESKKDFEDAVSDLTEVLSGFDEEPDEEPDTT